MGKSSGARLSWFFLLLPRRASCTVLFVLWPSWEDWGCPVDPNPVSEQPRAPENGEQGRAGLEMPFVQRRCIKSRKTRFQILSKIVFFASIYHCEYQWFTWSLQKTYHSDGQRMSICRAHFALRPWSRSQVVAGSEYKLELGHPCPTHRVSDLNS